MDYNTTEAINLLATQVVGLLEQGLASRAPTDRPVRLEQAESQLRDLLRALGAAALGRYLSTTVEAAPAATQRVRRWATLRPIPSACATPTFAPRAISSATAPSKAAANRSSPNASSARGRSGPASASQPR